MSQPIRDKCDHIGFLINLKHEPVGGRLGVASCQFFFHISDFKKNRETFGTHSFEQRAITLSSGQLGPTLHLTS